MNTENKAFPAHGEGGSRRLTEEVPRRAVFFDRDGTLNVDIHYLHRPEDFIWIPGAKEAIRHVNDRGYLAILVTNQSGVARGYYPESDVQRVYDWMNSELQKVGAHLDALYYCPHHPEGKVPAYTKTCSCRKPATGSSTPPAPATTSTARSPTSSATATATCSAPRTLASKACATRAAAARPCSKI